VSSSFKNLRSDVLIQKTSATGRGVIVFRNYIDAAVIAHMHSATLAHLITVEGLASITKAALKQFQKIGFQGQEASGTRLREQYRQDAEDAYRLLTVEPLRSTLLTEDVMEIRRILDEEF
jgi:hypothetical protein